jgi:hypothetical protein
MINMKQQSSNPNSIHIPIEKPFQLKKQASYKEQSKPIITSFIHRTTGDNDSPQLEQVRSKQLLSPIA